MDWSQTSLQVAFLGGVFGGLFRTPEAQRDWTSIRGALARCAQDMALLEHTLARRPYLAGDDLSLADIAVGTLLFRYFTLDIERPALPNVTAWYRRLEERPAYRENVMVPYDELFGRGV
jgi:glutathione S-transferase